MIKGFADIMKREKRWVMLEIKKYSKVKTAVSKFVESYEVRQERQSLTHSFKQWKEEVI